MVIPNSWNVNHIGTSNFNKPLLKRCYKCSWSTDEALYNFFYFLFFGVCILLLLVFQQGFLPSDPLRISTSSGFDICKMATDKLIIFFLGRVFFWFRREPEVQVLFRGDRKVYAGGQSRGLLESALVMGAPNQPTRCHGFICILDALTSLHTPLESLH